MLDLIYKICTILIAVGAPLGIAIKYVYDRGQAVYTKASERRKEEDRQELTITVKKILAEVLPPENNGMGNGGTTIKELAVQTKELTSNQMDKFTVLEEGLAAVTRGLAETNEIVGKFVRCAMDNDLEGCPIIKTAALISISKPKT